MSRQNTLFKYFWLIIEYFGLYYHELNAYEKRRAIVIFLSTTGVNLVLAIVALIVYDDIESRINALQTFPFFIQMLLDGSNFASKCRVIKFLSEKIEEAFRKIEGENFFNRGYRVVSAYAIYGAVSGSITLTTGVLLYLITGQTSVLIYNPFDGGVGFVGIWFLQAVFFYVTGLLNYLLDTFMNGLLILLSFYVKALRNHIRAKNTSEMREIIELDLELRGLLKSAEDAYSTVILSRGLMLIISISSIFLQVLNKESKETSTLVIFASNILFRFFMPTYFCNEIQFDYAELLRDIYGFDWAEASPKTRKDFIMIQENLQRDYRLKGAKIISIDLDTFLRIIRAAYSFYAVLRLVEN